MNVLGTLLPIAVGFLLTTVLGGLLGSYFQNRSWEHQHQIQQADEERLRTVQIAEENRARALQVFDEISRLMDKRLYRLRLAYLSLPTESGASDRSPQADERWRDYQQVLYEWNDSINRNLALLRYHFGSAARERLDKAVGGSFVELGSSLEAYGRAGKRPDGDKFEHRLAGLRSLVYNFNIEMIGAIDQSHQPLRVPKRMWQTFGRVCERQGTSRNVRIVELISAEIRLHGDDQDKAGLGAAGEESRERRSRKGIRYRRRPRRVAGQEPPGAAVGTGS